MGGVRRGGGGKAGYIFFILLHFYGVNLFTFLFFLNKYYGRSNCFGGSLTIYSLDLILYTAPQQQLKTVLGL